MQDAFFMIISHVLCAIAAVAVSIPDPVGWI